MISLAPILALGDTDSTTNRDNSRFQRFAYAHEFAHRFLFVLRDGHWIRALSIVAGEFPKESRLGPIRVLSRVEERICNSVAGRLLVPEKELRRHVTRALSNSQPSPHLLWEILGGVARSFQVSRWCAFRRMSSIKPDDLVRAMGESFCFLLVGQSVSTGAGHGASRIRLLDYWWPGCIDGADVRPVYPGLEIGRLGGELARVVASLIANTKEIAGEIVCPIDLKSEEGGQPKKLAAQLQGWWRTWTRTPPRQLAVYGVIGLRR